MINACEKCSGALTRSILLSNHPSNSPLCAVCWCNTERSLPLITLDELDQLIDLVPAEAEEILIKGLQCAWVDWHGEIGVITNTKGSMRIAVMLSCSRCGKYTETFYFGPGLHSGAWPYAYDLGDNYLANIRDQEFRCTECNKSE